MTNLFLMRQRTGRAVIPASLLAVPVALALLTIGVGRTTQTPFLSEALGKPAPSAPLVRRPARGVQVSIHRGGYQVAHRSTKVSLTASAAGGAWNRYARGAERTTPFGRETVVVGARTTEQFLTVDRRQGARTWRWRLQTGGLTPRVNPDGTVAFHDGALADVTLDPARILTPGGRDITPDGLAWSVERKAGAWWLTLPVDDTKLPVPYVIDPAISLRAAASANNGGGTASLTVNKPAGTAQSDFLLAMISVHGGTARTISAPGGWTLLRRENQSTNVAQAIYWLVAGGSEPASYQWTFNASDKATGGIIGYVGVDNSNPIDASSGQVSSANSNLVTAPSVTTSAANHRVVGFFGLNDNRTWTPPGGMVERWDTMSGSTSSEAADMTQVAAGATGSKTATASGSQAWVGQLVALRLDANPPTAPSLSVSESSADSYVSGTTFFYRPAGAGSTFTVSATSSDSESGLQKVTFPGLTAGFTPSVDTDDTSSPYSLVYTWPNGGGESGPQTVTAVDNAGNTATGDFTVTPDANAPTTTDDTASIGSSWKNTNQTVTLTPADGGGESGVASTYYTTDGTNPTLASPQGTSVSLTANGTYTVKYFSTDQVANQEAVQTAGTQIRIDKTNPSGATLDALPGTIADGQVLTGSGTDALSGVGSISYYYCPGFPCTPSTLIGSSSTGPNYSVTWATQPADGTYQVLARVFDAAGNSLDSTKQTVTIENAPITTIDSNPANPTNSGTASFDFSADDPAATFECQLDGGGFSACTSPQTYLALPAGSHTFQVRGIDTLFNVGDPASYTWTIDLTAPNTTVDTNPSNPTGSTGATFTFSSTEGGSTFECQLDGGGFSSCSSPKSYAGLSGGAHTFQVRATDPAGNTDPSPASYGWTIDLTPPDTSITSSPANPTNATGASFTFSSTEGGSTFECQLDGGGFSSCSSPKSYAGLSAGSHTFDVRATDSVGNTDGSPASFTWTIDTTAPNTSITGGPPSSTNATAATFSFTSTEGGSTFECQLDGGGFGACTSPQTYLALGAGSHTFQVRATDPAGNTDGTPASQTWTIDTTAPNTSVDTGPSNPTGSTAASFAFSSTEGGSTFECQLDGGGFSSCTSPQVYAGLSGGAHAFQVRATDPAGNTDSSPATWSWSIDSTAPTASVDTGPASPTTATDATFTFSANEPSTFECLLDAGAWVPCGSPKGYLGLGNGAHTFQVRATDTVGNTGAAASYGWTIDLSPPNTTITGSPASPTNLTDASFTFTSTEPGSTFECALDGGAFSACTSPRSYSGLASGPHTFQVRATDPVGNTDPTPDSTAWTIDNTAPTATIDFGPADPTGSTSATFTFSSSEGGSTFQCQLDGGGYGVCASPVTYIGLAEGQHTFRVKAIDAVGNVGMADTETWNIDRTPPDAVVDTSPADPSNSANASFTFSASEPGSTFQCQLDGGGYAGCASPRNYSGLAPGSHTFQVKATDPLGNAGSAATQTWTIDTIAPTVGLDDPGAVLAGTVHLTASASDANGVGSVRFERSPAGANAWVTIDTDTGAPFAAEFVTGAAADGFWDVRAVATDAAGNTTTTPVATRRVDNTAPVATLAIAKLYVRQPVQMTATAADDGSGVASVTFQRSPRGANNWSTISVATAAPYTSSFDPSGLGDAQYDVRAVVADAAGNVAAPSLAVVVATSGIGVSLANPGPALSGTVTLTATTSGLGAQQVAFEIKRTGSANWMPLATDLVAPWSAPFDTSLLRDGTYDLRATTVDADGVLAVDVITGIRLDNTAPEFTKSVPAAGARTSSDKVSVTADEAIASVTGVKLDGSATVVPTIKGATATFDFRALKPGAHVLTGTLVDAAGLRTPFTLKFTVVGSLSARLGAPRRSGRSVAVPVTVSGRASATVRVVTPGGRSLAVRKLTAAKKGTYRVSLPLPAKLAPGRYSVSLVATAPGATVKKSALFTVAAAPPSAPGATWVIVRS